MSAAAEFVARAFAARTAAHLAHLKSRSYAAHMALEGFYEDIIDVADRFCEVYQGLFDLKKRANGSGHAAGKPARRLRTADEIEAEEASRAEH